MSRVPGWGVATAAAAPILLIGGWTIAAGLQPSDFDPVSQTISELAGADAAHRWVMTLAILGTGVCQVLTAVALRPAATAGRVLLATAGASTVLVALNPLPPGGQGATVHAVVAAGSFGALATWPLVAWRRGPYVPWALRRSVSVTAGIGLVVVTALFFAAVLGEGSRVGLIERLAAALNNLWPLAVALTAWISARASSRRSP